MKTDELWRWIWTDDDLVDPVGDLLGPEAGRAAGLEPPPAIATEGVWEWVASDEDLIDPDLLDLDLEPKDPSATPWAIPEQPSATPPTSPPEPSASPSGTRGVPSGYASGSAVYPVVEPLVEPEAAFEPPPPPPPPPPLVEPNLEGARAVGPAPVVEPQLDEPILEQYAEFSVEPIVEPQPGEPFAPPSGTRGVPSGDASGLTAEPVAEQVVEAVVEVPPTVEEPPVPAIEDVRPVVSPASTEVEAPVAPQEPVAAPHRTVTLEPPAAPPEPARPRAGSARWARLGAFVAVAAVIGAVAPKVLPAILPGDDGNDGPAAAVPDQQVVAWTVRLDEAPDATLVAILAAGVKPPVIMAVPADVTINVPGQGLGTVGEAAAGGDVSLVAVALENLIGVRMDGSVDSTTAELQAAVDALGTIEVADQPMAGAQVIAYLTALDPGALPDERFLRWQDVLEGIRDGVAANPAAVAGFPDPLRPVLAAGSPEPMALYGLPVVDLGAGLLRPDEEALGTLVEDLFVPHAGAEVRIVVLNGVGRPGVGEQVARILVPEGYRLMSTGNANTFGVKTTKIIALSEDDLGPAQRARELLGVGQVLRAEPTGLADLQIVVGQDFVDATLGGA